MKTPDTKPGTKQSRLRHAVLAAGTGLILTGAGAVPAAAAPDTGTAQVTDQSKPMQVTLKPGWVDLDPADGSDEGTEHVILTLPDGQEKLFLAVVPEDASVADFDLWLQTPDGEMVVDGVGPSNIERLTLIDPAGGQYVLSVNYFQHDLDPQNTQPQTATLYFSALAPTLNPDTIEIAPGQVKTVDVLANDVAGIPGAQILPESVLVSVAGSAPSSSVTTAEGVVISVDSESVVTVDASAVEPGRVTGDLQITVSATNTDGATASDGVLTAVFPAATPDEPVTEDEADPVVEDADETVDETGPVVEDPEPAVSEELVNEEQETGADETGEAEPDAGADPDESGAEQQADPVEDPEAVEPGAEVEPEAEAPQSPTEPVTAEPVTEQEPTEVPETEADPVEELTETPEPTEEAVTEEDAELETEAEAEETDPESGTTQPTPDETTQSPEAPETGAVQDTETVQETAEEPAQSPQSQGPAPHVKEIIDEAVAENDEVAGGTLNPDNLEQVSQDVVADITQRDPDRAPDRLKSEVKSAVRDAMAEQVRGAGAENTVGKNAADTSTNTAKAAGTEAAGTTSNAVTPVQASAGIEQDPSTRGLMLAGLTGLMAALMALAAVPGRLLQAVSPRTSENQRR